MAAELAAAAHLEGAAVFAFEALERELLAHGAPLELVARARSAQRDEKRHHSSMSRLARRLGAEAPPVELDQVPVRSLLELAAENAVEGCIRETYGAAVAAFQAEWAHHPAMRRAMRSIALDEAEHASLGWAVDTWARSKLPHGARSRLDAERELARANLLIDSQRPVAAELTIVLGLPTPAASAALSAALEPLWT